MLTQTMEEGDDDVMVVVEVFFGLADDSAMAGELIGK